MKTKLDLKLVCFGLLPSAFCLSLRAQGTAFTYQGRLNDGANPAAGIYDLRFTIYDSTNLPGTIVAGPLTNSVVAVSNGLFTVALDFGAGPFTNGAARWLEIGVRTNGSGAFAPLTPRQSIAPSPYAMFAGRMNATGINGTIAAANFAGTYGNSVTFSNAANSFGGSGAGLTGLNASQLTGGTVPDSRLSANVALRNTTNTFTGNQTIVSGNLGVGTNASSARLEVAGQIKVTGGSPGLDKVLTSDAAGLARWAAPPTVERVVTVDAGGNGDYTTINAAVAAINPTATNPFVIFVRPGTYVETVWLKSYVHLKGAGRDFTFIEGDPVGATNTFEKVAIGLDHVTNAMISGFTLTAHAGSSPPALAGIYDNGSSPVIIENVFRDFAGLPGNPDNAAFIYSTDSSPVIERNIFTNWAYVEGGIFLRRSSAVITGNQFLRAAGLDYGVMLEKSSARITANEFNHWSGVYIENQGTNGLSVIIALNNFLVGAKAVYNHGDARIFGNHIDSYGEAGIYNRGPAIIAANVFTNSSRPVWEINTLGTTITGNTFHDGAIQIENSSPVVTGNFLNDTDIDVVSGSPVISGNRIVGIIDTGSGSPILSGNDIDIVPGSYTGNATLAGLGAVNLKVAGSNLLVNATGTVDVRAKLNVTNSATFGGDVSAAGDLTVSGNLNVNGAIGGSFASLRGGTGQFTNNVSAGSLNVTGPATFNSLVSANLLDVSGPATFDSLVSAAFFTGDGSALTGIHSLDAADGNPTDAVFVNNSGKVGVGLSNPLHRLHVGSTLGTNAFNASTNVIAIEDANEDGRATFLALAGIGGPDTTNRVEVQIEAVESSRRGIIGTTTEHPVYLRVGNSDTMVLATSRFVGIGTNAPAERLHVIGNILATGTITPNSDRNAKTDIQPVDVAAILERVSTLPIQQWRFKTESEQVKHVGPMAQDFRAAFGLGAHETAIATVDADGVALAAIQGLNEKVEVRSEKSEVRIQKLEAENVELKQRLAALEQFIRNQRPN